MFFLHIKIQNFYSIENYFESHLNDDNGKLYKDFKEKIEYELFWKSLIKVSMKGALFILESNNYNNCIKNFNKKFKSRHTKNLKEIISKESFDLYLKPLGVIYKELIINVNKVYKNINPNNSIIEQKITYDRD